MEDSIKLKLLLILKNRGSITDLIKDGFTYGQIADMISHLVEEGYADEIDDQLQVSEKGMKWLNIEFKTNKLKGSESWIVPEKRSKIPQVDKNEVYLPNRNELHF